MSLLRHYYVTIKSLLRHYYVTITSLIRHYYVIITSLFCVQALLECTYISWFYGLDRLDEELEERSGLTMNDCWYVIFVRVIFVRVIIVNVYEQRLDNKQEMQIARTAITLFLQ